MTEQWDGETERRKKDLLTEHRLTVIETHVPQIYEQIKGIKQEVREEGIETRTAFETYVKPMGKRVSSLELWRSFLAGAYAMAAIAVSAVGAWFKTHGK